MGPNLDSHSDVTSLWELEGNFSSLACHAAIEIEKLLCDQASSFDAVHLLAKVMTSRLIASPEPASIDSLLDTSTAIVVDEAIKDSRQGTGPQTVMELIQEAGEISESLMALSESPRDLLSGDREKMEYLRSFCMALSDRALGREAETEESDVEVLLWD